MAKQLVLLTYTPRELSEDEYAKFIREIDYRRFARIRTSSTTRAGVSPTVSRAARSSRTSI